MRRGLAVGLAGIFWATPGHAREATYRLGVPVYVDPGLHALFPGPQRLGLGAEWGLGGPWSLSIDTHWLQHDWGTTRYTLSLTPLLLRHRLALTPSPDAPFLTLGLGAAAMTLAGGHEGFRIGTGAAFAAGIGLPLGRSLLAQLELQQGVIHSIHYLGFGLTLGMRLAASEPSRMRTSERPSRVPATMTPPRVAAKPPLPRGTLIRVGAVSEVQGERVRVSLDDLPYQVRPGDVLVIYFQERVPIKVAKIRIDSVDPDGRAASGTVLAATEAIRRGYALGTL